MNYVSSVQVYVEIEKHTNIKYEFCKCSNSLVVDRVLPYPYFYPYAYGFIPNTLAPDNDELDILIISEKHLPNDRYYRVKIIGALLMEDEKGKDDKILCVLEEESEHIKDIDDLSDCAKDGIFWFFSNYKSTTQGKWSKVGGLKNKEEALKIYSSTILS